MPFPFLLGVALGSLAVVTYNKKDKIKQSIKNIDICNVKKTGCKTIKETIDKATKETKKISKRAISTTKEALDKIDKRLDGK